MNTPLDRALAFLQSLKNFLLTGGQLVDQNTANIRGAICVACHNNQTCETVRPKGKGVCGSCARFIENATVKLAKAGILQGRQTPSQNALKCCALCGCDNSLAIWFPTVPLGSSAETANAWPEYCYKKQVTL